MNRRKTWAAAAFIVLLVLLAAACGRGDDGERNEPFGQNGPQNETRPDPADNRQPDADRTGNEPDVPGKVEIEFVPAFTHETFREPTAILHAGDGSGRLFIAEQPGVISVLSDTSDSAERNIFLDIGEIVTDDGWEQGLLGLAFHSDYKSNGLFYVNYTKDNKTIIEQYSVTPDNPDKADETSGRVILEFEQPYENHNGGQLAFGPDGYLYIATGDGGGAGDPLKNGQNLQTLLGKILRIDVDNATSGRAYAIPPDNPFVGNTEGFREEIFAYGLRNPWRFSFDEKTGKLWAADVGQDRVEEINLIESGKNYGWSVLEGNECFKSGDCDREGMTPPVWSYRPAGGRASVTGGYFYYGKEIPALQGGYLFADFMDGRVFVMRYDGEHADVEQLPVKLREITTFGVDESGELYAGVFGGTIYRVKAK